MSGYVVRVTGGNGVAGELLAVLAKLPGVRIEQIAATEEARPLQRTCAVCKHTCAADSMARHDHLGEACGLCVTTARRLEDRIQAAAKKHFADFYAQLPQLVRDVRSGAEEPVFYRGLE